MPDVFPRRNLSAESEEWGREVERRIVLVEGIAAQTKSGLAGQNRTTASTLGDLTRQLQRLDDLYRAIPKPVQKTVAQGGFGLSGGWQSLATVELSAPSGAQQAEILAFGSAFLTSTTASLVGGSMRLVAEGSASPVQPWATYSDVSGFHASATPGYSWRLPIAENEVLTVSLQVIPDDPATWGAIGGNYATVGMLVTFTG